MHDGVRVDAGATPGSGIGYVPQDDIIHVEMPLRRTLWYAARVLVRNRLTLAILLGSPVLVTAMMSMLFQAGSFERHGATDVSPAQIVFWVAFARFFFGLTYGCSRSLGSRRSSGANTTPG